VTSQSNAIKTTPHVRRAGCSSHDRKKCGVTRATGGHGSVNGCLAGNGSNHKIARDNGVLTTVPEPRSSSSRWIGLVMTVCLRSTFQGWTIVAIHYFLNNSVGQQKDKTGRETDFYTRGHHHHHHHCPNDRNAQAVPCQVMVCTV
jgi:hypothetical protein